MIRPLMRTDADDADGSDSAAAPQASPPTPLFFLAAFQSRGHFHFAFLALPLLKRRTHYCTGSLPPPLSGIPNAFFFLAATRCALRGPKGGARAATAASLRTVGPAAAPRRRCPGRCGAVFAAGYKRGWQFRSLSIYITT
jgi:hypothetical protein